MCHLHPPDVDDDIDDNNYKWSEIVDKRPHCHLVTPRGGKLICLTLTPSNTWFLGFTWVIFQNSISVSTAVFAYTAAKTPNAFQWSGEPAKLPLPLGGSGPHLIHGSWAHPSQSSNGIWIDLPVFAQLTHVPYTLGHFIFR